MSKYISPEEFQSEGYLLEVNRHFLHPLGLALAVNLDDEGGSYSVKDCRDDPEGIWFDGFSESDLEKIRNVIRLTEERFVQRLERLGFWVEPSDEDNNLL